MKVTIEVNEKDIMYGVAHNPYYCPIARAVRRYTKFQPCVTCVLTFLNNEGDHYTYAVRLPEEAQSFAAKFDKTETGDPFSFAIDIDEKYLKGHKNENRD